MSTPLNDNEVRVLGVLIEKSLTQPENYPLTMNAIVLGANQKQNRNPVMTLNEADVARALGSLQSRELVEQAPPSPGARSNRFRHRVVEVFKWDRRDQAIMAELMLRGRQTAGELRTHASRMTPFSDLTSVLTTLRSLAEREEPFVEELPREPGRSANRWRHRLGGADRDEQGGSAEGASAATGLEASSGSPVEHAELASVVIELNTLRHKVERLEARLAALESRML